MIILFESKEPFFVVTLYISNIVKLQVQVQNYPRMTPVWA